MTERISVLAFTILCLLANVTANPCSSNPCPANTHLCLESGESFNCLCINPVCFPVTTTTPKTTTIEGETTPVKVNHCASNPCNEGFLCVNYVSTFNCLCISSFCQPTTTTPKTNPTSTLPDPCSSSPCLNGGFCQANSNGYTCSCIPGFTGSNCQDFNECFYAPCYNGGTCYRSNGTYGCDCPAGYIGKNCEKNDFCMPNPCLNNGTCVQKTEFTAVCECPPNYTGYICENVNPCMSNSCQNGATCLPSYEGSGIYQCQCPSGFSGIKCELDLSSTCTPQTCLNGGSCSINPETQKNFCACPVYYTGTRCETSFNPCFTQIGEPICQNFGSCSVNFEVSPFYQCSCGFGFTGKNCEIIQTTTKFSTMSTSRGPCVDRDAESCKYYADNSFCSNFFYIDQVPIPQYCAKSCNTCTDSVGETTVKQCEDSQFSCVYWGQSGNCGILPDPNICKKSCGLC